MHKSGRKQSSWRKVQKHDPSFYLRFRRAWTNLQENEAEARLQLIIADRKVEERDLHNSYQ